DAIGYGVLNTLKDIHIAGGDVLAKRAFYAAMQDVGATKITKTINMQTMTNHNTNVGLETLLGNLATAGEYKAYLDNAAVINAVMADNLNTPFTLGWLASIAQASAIGLDARHASDWYGGWKEYLAVHKVDARTVSVGFEDFARTLQGRKTDGTAVVLDDTLNPSGKDKLIMSDTNGRLLIEGREIVELGNAEGIAAQYKADAAITTAAYIIGGSGSDSITAGDLGADVLGGDGADVLIGGLLDDWIVGGADNDVIDVAAGNGNYAQGDDGNDLLIGGAGSDFLVGSAGNDQIFAGAGDDILEGGAGSDKIHGGAGADIYLYRAGNGIDYLKDGGTDTGVDVVTLVGLARATATFVRSSADDDIVVQFGSLRDRNVLVLEEAGLDARGGIEQLTFNDSVMGATNIIATARMSTLGVNGITVSGGTGTQTLSGGLYDDSILAGAGNDLLHGSYGSDIYRFNATDGNDTLTEEGFDADVDRVILGTGLTAANVTIRRGDIVSDALSLNWAGTGQLTLQQVSDVGENAVESIQFADNAHLTLYDLRQTYVNRVSSAADSIIGFAGDDKITTLGGNDTIQAAGGDDWLDAGAGNDTYIYLAGDGNDTISESWGSSGTDILRFGTGITVDDLRVHISPANDKTMILDFGNRSGSVALVGQNISELGIEQIAFADGTVLSKSQLWQMYQTQHTLSVRGDAIYGTDNAESLRGGVGNDTLLGYAGDDTLTGGKGNDFLLGNAGVNRYIYSRGDGIDAISTDVAGTTILELRSIAQNEVSFNILTGSWSERAMQLRLPEGQIQVWEKYGTLGSVVFAGSNTSMTYQQMTQAYLADRNNARSDVVYGTAVAESITAGGGNDTINAGGGNDTLRGGTGADHMYGAEGNDLYLYALGDGHDVIQDADAVVELLGITSSSVNIHRTMYNFNAIGIDFTAQSGAIVWDGGGSGASTSLKMGATVWNQQQMMADYYSAAITTGNDMVIGGRQSETLDAGTGNDIVYGWGGLDTIIAGAGNDLLIGQEERDVYRYTVGSHGHDTIHDNDGVVQLSNVTAAQVRVAGYAGHSNDVVLRFDNGTGSIRLMVDFVWSNNISVQFSDGTLWNADAIRAKAVSKVMSGYTQATSITGSTASEVIEGSLHNDTITGGAGDDLLKGNSGNDTYAFNLTSGHDMIMDASGGNILVLSGVNAADARLRSYQESEKSQITWNNGEASVRVDLDAVSQLRFADKTLTTAQFVNPFLTQAGSGNDFLRGTDFANQILGGAGDDLIYGEGFSDRDTITGGKGNDLIYDWGNTQYVFNVGDGQDTIVASGLEEYTLRLAGFTTSQLQLTQNAEGIFRLVLSNNDSIYFGDSLPSQVIFDNATLTKQQFLDSLFLRAAASNDSIRGIVGDEAIYGGDGDDWIAGGIGNDTLAGGKGNDYLDGGGISHDTYIFNIGDGQDTITESVVTTSTLRFGAGIQVEDISIDAATVHGQGSMRFNIGNGTDAVTIVNRASVAAWHLQFEFTQQNLTLTGKQMMERLYLAADARNDSLDGTGSDDRINGGAGDDLIRSNWSVASDSLTGGAGFDRLEGSLHNEDHFYFYLGDEQDTIYAANGVDFLHLGGGLRLETMRVVQTYNDDLLLRFGDTRDSILIEKFFNDSGFIETIQFVDGSSVNGNQLKRLQYITTDLGIKPSASMTDDVIVSGQGQDTLEGGLGDDTLRGGAGNDTYSFVAGDGRDAIFDAAGNDRIDLSGYNFEQISISAALGDSDDLIVHLGVNGEQIYLDEQRTTGRIETIRLANGVQYTADANGNFIIPSTGNNTLIGNALGETLTGGLGNDTLYGGGGADTYVWKSGDGNDFIVDLGSDTDTDVLRLNNVALSALRVRADAATGNILLSINSEQITLQGIETVVLSDATLDRQQIWQRLITQAATSGDDVIAGSKTNDTLAGGGGNDLLMGDAGNDEYRFNIGDGVDRIVDSSGTDTLRFGTAILATAITILRSDETPDDLIVRLSATDRVALAGINSSNSVEQVQFADSTRWTVADMQARYIANAATSGNDTIEGFASNNTLSGGNGNDVLRGAAGNDSLLGGTGDDTLQGDAGNDTLRGDDGNDRLIGSIGNDVIDGGAGIDTLYLAAEVAAWQINLTTLTATNGNATLSLSSVEHVITGSGSDTITGNTGANRLESSAHNDHIVAGSGNDTLIGGAGADTLNGEAGADVFVFSREGDSLNLARDRISDFVKGTDKIDLSRYMKLGDNFSAADDLSVVFTGVIAGAANNNLLGYSYNATHNITTLSADADVTDFVLNFTGNIAFTAADFIFGA
ncbi:MAG: hypothetical protein EAZ74_02040, partial [Alphaproteobacteria bacterium]